MAVPEDTVLTRPADLTEPPALKWKLPVIGASALKKSPAPIVEETENCKGNSHVKKSEAFEIKCFALF